MSGTKTTVTDNGVEVIFEFSNATINVGDSNIDTLLESKAERQAIDSAGHVWFTTKSNVKPTDKAQSGGLGSTNIWSQIGTIPLGTKTLYVWECTMGA